MAKESKKMPISFGLIKPREIVDEMRESYLDYAMSVIVSRALPDVRDGLKPVHRRILYAMMEDGLHYNGRFRKSATVVGSVLGRYHPHGDAAVYDSMVRMAQDFSMRYMLVNGQGNFGCFTKDTKVKLVDGRSLSFGDLIKEKKQGKKNYTFAFNHEAKKIEIAEIINPRLTGRRKELMEIELDNGEKIKCTLSHKFLLRKGIYREAKDLKIGESLMPGYFNMRQIRDGKHYSSILQPFTFEFEFVHRLADEFNVRFGKAREELIKNYILHHKDFNHLNNSPENIIRLTWKEHHQLHLEKAKNLWKEKGHLFREKHRETLRKIFSNPTVREEISKRSKALWNNSEYRAKYPADHFVKMAKELWSNPETKELHRKKALKQWQDPKFQKIVSEATSARDLKRLKKNPNMIKEMTEKAKVALHKNWNNPEYKENIIRNKILYYVNYLLSKHPKITKKIYNEERYNNCFPKFDNAVKHFNGFSEIIDQAKNYNHKIVKIKFLQKREDVYDLTTERWHNFLLDAGVFVHNSIDGDPAASMRYSEAKLSRIGEEMLNDIDKDTVDFMDNYDGTRKEPTVLPSPLPQLLLNGSFGIAVGMATSIPPHNLTELCDALFHLIGNPKATTEELFEFVKGPDFPTGGIIYGKKDIIAAYSIGKGPMVVRGRAEVVEKEKTGSEQIIISEIPYQVQKSTLVEQFANLVQEKRVIGIRDIRDESDRDGMRIAIDLQKGAFPQKILNRLYKFTDLQKTFHLNMLALVDGIQPRVLSLADVLNYFIEHRKVVVERRTKYDLQRAKERVHILEGLHKCLDKIDLVIKIIRGSKDREDAKNNLMAQIKLTEIQANAILETKLAALAKLERQRIEDELKALLLRIKEYLEILGSPQKIKEVVKKELKEIKEKFGDERKTKIFVQQVGEIAEEDLIPQEETILTLTQGGYIKRINPGTYKLQKRGGKGILGMKTLQEDIVEHFLLAQTHDSLFFFTDSGKVFSTVVYEIPEGTRVARGRGLLNFIELSAQEKVLSLLTTDKKDAEAGVKDLVMITQNGIIKRTALEDFKNVRKSGLIAIKLLKDDLLKRVVKSTGEDDVVIATKAGQSIRFKEKQVREMGRPARIRGISLRKGDKVVGMDVVPSEAKLAKGEKAPERFLLVVMENGYGKRTDIKEYRLQGRGGSGIKTANITPKTGELVFSKVLNGEEEDLIVISRKGHVIRTEIGSIPKLSRATQGVRIMRLEEGDKVASAMCI